MKIVEELKKLQLAAFLLNIMSLVFLTTLTIVAYKHQQWPEFLALGVLDLLAAGCFVKLIQLSR